MNKEKAVQVAKQYSLMSEDIAWVFEKEGYYLPVMGMQGEFTNLLEKGFVIDQMIFIFDKETNSVQ